MVLSHVALLMVLPVTVRSSVSYSPNDHRRLGAISCIECGSPSIPGKMRCATHNTKSALRTRKFKAGDCVTVKSLDGEKQKNVRLEKLETFEETVQVPSVRKNSGIHEQIVVRNRWKVKVHRGKRQSLEINEHDYSFVPLYKQTAQTIKKSNRKRTISWTTTTNFEASKTEKMRNHRIAQIEFKRNRHLEKKINLYPEVIKPMLRREANRLKTQHTNWNKCNKDATPFHTRAWVRETFFDMIGTHGDTFEAKVAHCEAEINALPVSERNSYMKETTTKVKSKLKEFCKSFPKDHPTKTALVSLTQAADWTKPTLPMLIAFKGWLKHAQTYPDVEKNYAKLLASQ